MTQPMLRVLAIVIAMVLGLATVSNADDTDVQAGTNSYQVLIASTSDAQAESIESTTTSAEVTYSYQPACVRGEGITGADFYGCGKQMKCGERGHVFNVFAHHPDETTVALGSQCFEPSEVPVAATVTADAVLRAFRRIPVPASEVSIQPPGGETLVNLDTVFSTEANSFSRTIGLLGHRVELDIRPAEFHWVSGDGTTQVTEWAGKPWQKGTPLDELITHRYEQADRALRPRVDTVWTARYRVDGGPWQDVGGTVTITGEAFDLAVLSAAPHLSG